ncbi:MAG: deoxyribodipyrimidine photo-lyase [Verrucomicrobiota bacterium]
MKTLFWFRRDLRLRDLTGLHLALEESDHVTLCTFLDPEILDSKETSPARIAFFLKALESLKVEIEERGGSLCLIRGNPQQNLVPFAESQQIKKVFWHRDYEPYAIQRDQEIEQRCALAGISVEVIEDQCLQAPGTVLKGDGDPYVVFTPYFKQWKNKDIAEEFPAPKSLKKAKVSDPPLVEFSIKEDSFREGLFPASEKAAWKKLLSFKEDHVIDYDSARDIPALEGTSRLSPYLRFGIISARSVYHELKHLRSEGYQTYLSELAWRDFYKQILHFFPHVATGSYRKEYNAIPWPNSKEYFQAWCDGRTGFPIVDAAMRQLNETGWMHNRLRMITASFLTKDLQVDWRWGERYFMLKLLDGDLAANNGGWQWAAGTGTDAAPYFRIFNPTRQAEKFDPEGKFIEKMVPEIDSADYPAPIVDHSQMRDSTLKLYKSALGK